MSACMPAVPNYWGACEDMYKMVIFVYLVILRLDVHSFLGACENGAKLAIYLILPLGWTCTA
jgi:hypothetical protein